MTSAIRAISGKYLKNKLIKYLTEREEDSIKIFSERRANNYAHKRIEQYLRY
jgi:hypothetical protein